MPKVLLVEDDPLIIRLYTKTLELEGFEVVSAENGQAGLEQLSLFKPDIILLDIKMPKMNGVEFLSHIKAGTGIDSIPVIVLTNVSDSDVKLSAVYEGASLILNKSQTEPDEVVSTIKKVLSKEILQESTLTETKPTEEVTDPNQTQQN